MRDHVLDEGVHGHGHILGRRPYEQRSRGQLHRRRTVLVVGQGGPERHPLADDRGRVARGQPALALWPAGGMDHRGQHAFERTDVQAHPLGVLRVAQCLGIQS